MNDLRSRAEAFLLRASPFGPKAGSGDCHLLIRRYLDGGPWNDLVPLNRPETLLAFMQDLAQSTSGERKTYLLDLLEILKGICAEVPPLRDATPAWTASTEDLKVGELVENDRRKREIQILVNIIEPDPQYQPWFLADGATVFDISLLEENTIRARLETYFRRPLPVSLAIPLWRLVDALKVQHPDWPDDWSPDHESKDCREISSKDK